MSRKRVGIILFLLFLVYYLIFLAFPLLLVGPPTSLFYIDNDDILSHEVVVSIFDENNRSVFNATYLLIENESVSFEREVSWYLPFPSTFVTWSDGVYRFNFTVDYTFSKEITRDINQYESIMVDVFSMDYPKVLVPIKIRVISV